LNIVHAPRFCPVCTEEVWNDQKLRFRAQEDGQREGLAWNQEFAQLGTGPFARELYVEHVNRYHSEFARWENRTYWYSLLSFIVAFAILLLILASSVNGYTYAPTADTTLYEIIFTSWVILSTLLFLNRWRGRTGFRESWNEEHGIVESSG